MRVVVLGGTGFIGSWVTRQLVEQGHAVRVLHQGRKGADELVAGAVYVVGKAALDRVEAVEAALRGWEPDAVIHILALSEADALAASSVLAGRTGRIVVLSSGDVYLAYGRFMRLEPGLPEPDVLDADRSPLRGKLYPYRTDATAPGTLAYEYDKILVEQVFRAGVVPSVILRLPKVYGAGGNADFATVYGFAEHTEWRWTHGYVENVAAAIVLAATHPQAVGRVYNVGEQVTPTVGERLRNLPAGAGTQAIGKDYDFRQNIVYDTSPIRIELGFKEPIGYLEGLARTLERTAVL